MWDSHSNESIQCVLLPIKSSLASPQAKNRNTADMPMRIIVVVDVDDLKEERECSCLSFMDAFFFVCAERHISP
eukprot:gene7072-5010_t